MIRPDAEQARRMNVELEGRLATALEHLVGEVLGRIPITLTEPSPAAFGLQGLLRDRALASDLDGLAALLDRLGPILGRASTPAGLVRPLAGPWFTPEEMDVLRLGFTDDIGLTARLEPPPAEVGEEAAATIRAVLACMAEDAPAWHGEFRILVRQVVLACAGADRQVFAGASAFDLWGAILVNPCYRRDPIHLAMTLVHESSHLKLFHAYLDDEIVLNDPEDRYSSPLRREPRPMNGLYHAAFVLARMASFAILMMEARTAAPVFGPGWRDRFQAEAQAAVARFDSGHEIIARHGRLTPRGTALMAEAAAAVDEARHLAVAA